MTNWDKMKQMDIKEVAEKFVQGCPTDFVENCHQISCKKCWEQWLNTGVNDEVLKPCPFCGQTVAEIKTNQELYPFDENLCHPHYYGVRCNFNNGGCGTTLGGESKTKKEAIEKWNTRFGEV